MANKKTLRTLGIDLGTNSLGWCLIETEGEPGAHDAGRIIAAGSRIFSDGRDPKSKASLAVARREARSMRRRRDRYVRRRKALLRALTGYGLMPAGDTDRKEVLRQTDDGPGGDLSKSLYALRAKALDSPLHPHQIGRILFHLDQRRGFKSNRKTDRRDNEAGKIATGVARLDQSMMELGARSYGEFLYKRRLEGNSVRTRLRPETGEEARGDGYDFYPSRAALETEFDTICSVQSVHHPDILTEERVAHLRNIIFFQRPLAPGKVGRCSYNEDELRVAKAHPLFQAFRLYKEVNELELIGEDQRHRKLTPEQRDILVSKLRSSRSAGFPALRKTLKLGGEIRFNKESGSRSKLTGDETYAALSHKDRFGARWSTFDERRQWEIVQKLRNTEDPAELHDWLVSDCGLDDDNARSVAAQPMPDGYGRIGETALRSLLDALENEVDEGGCVITEAEAAKRCGYNHSDKSDPDFEGHELLPPYQEVLGRHIPPGTGNPDDVYDVFKGRVTNPTVHIALNQLRRVVNALIARHGRPDRIAIELGRDLKLNDKQKDEINRTISRNTGDAERRSETLRGLGQPDTGYNRLLLKLWEELDSDDPLNRVCIYSGQPISIGMLFTAEIDIDHILPYSRTLDDSQGNKIVCMAHANRQKRNRPPADVAEWQGHYGDILARAGALPRNKQWRFAADAMDRFTGENDFLARQLTDMQYVSRMGLTYLASLYPTEEADADGVLRRHSRVRALPGRTTEMLRRHWGLNDLLPDHNHSATVKEKNRKDHRHHAIDAAVIAATSRASIQKIATASAANEAGGLERVIGGFGPPWQGFRDELREVVRNVIVSHKPDHGTVSRAGYRQGKGQTAGKLHNDTAYGLTDEIDSRGARRVVRRKALADFASARELADIRDQKLKEKLQRQTQGLNGKEFQRALLDFSRNDAIFMGIRRVRVLETLATIPIRNPAGHVYKSYKGDSNLRFDVWRLPDGKWAAEVISMFDAHRPDWRSRIKQEFPSAAKVLRLHQNDMVAYEHPELGRTIARVVKFGANGQITFAAHNEGGDLKRRDELPVEPMPEHPKYPEEFDTFKYYAPTAGGLKKMKVRQIRIDELGYVFDPGPRCE